MPNDTYPYDAKARVLTLIASLKTLVQRDPDQEVTGVAIPVLAAVLSVVKAARPNDPVVGSVIDLYEMNLLSEGEGEKIRAADMLLIAEQLDAALGPYPLGNPHDSAPRRDGLIPGEYGIET